MAQRFAIAPGLGWLSVGGGRTGGLSLFGVSGGGWLLRGGGGAGVTGSHQAGPAQLVAGDSATLAGLEADLEKPGGDHADHHGSDPPLKVSSPFLPWCSARVDSSWPDCPGPWLSDSGHDQVMAGCGTRLARALRDLPIAQPLCAEGAPNLGFGHAPLLLGGWSGAVL